MTALGFFLFFSGLAISSPAQFDCDGLYKKDLITFDKSNMVWKTSFINGEVLELNYNITSFIKYSDVTGAAVTFEKYYPEDDSHLKGTVFMDDPTKLEVRIVIYSLKNGLAYIIKEARTEFLKCTMVGL